MEPAALLTGVGEHLADRGAASQQTGIGIRELIQEAIPRANLDIVTFDTRVKVPGMPGSAAKSASAHHVRGERAAARRSTTATSRPATMSVNQTITTTMISKRSPRSIPRTAETPTSTQTTLTKLSTKSQRIVRSTLTWTN